MNAFARLEDAILDEAFPDVDLALRRGRHIDHDDAAFYAFLVDAQDHLEPFYRRFGCELVHKSDGYFYLLPVGDKLGRRHLSLAEMLVGQALTLLYLDAETLDSGGIVDRDRLLSHLANLMGPEGLVHALVTKRRKYDERLAADAVRAKVGDALRKLAALGFVELAPDQKIRLRASLLRFVEPVRGTGSEQEALSKLVAKGELVYSEHDRAAGDEEASHEGVEREQEDERDVTEEP